MDQILLIYYEKFMSSIAFPYLLSFLAINSLIRSYNYYQGLKLYYVTKFAITKKGFFYTSIHDFDYKGLYMRNLVFKHDASTIF